MEKAVGNTLATRMKIAHDAILRVTEDLSEEQLGAQPSPTASPIGWHLWHIARWADLFQASFAPEDGNTSARPQFWESENLAAEWGLRSETLGVLQSGLGMTFDAAATIPLVGKTRILDYARRAFAAADQCVLGLDVQQLIAPRESFARWKIAQDEIIEARGAETTLIADISYHLTQANRHLGMIEALRGATLKLKGSASI